MKLKLLLALSFLLLTGCVTWDILDVTVWLDPDSTGKFAIATYPVGSDSETSADREEDLSYLLFEVMENEDFAPIYLSDVERNLTIEGDGLKASMTAKFNDLQSLEKITEIERGENGFVRKINQGEEVVETNGKVIKTNDGVVLVWDKTAKKLHFKLKSLDSFFSKEWQAPYSLLPEYKRFLHDEGPLRRSLVLSKMAKVRSYLENNQHDEAYSILELVLRVAPGEPVVRQELKKLHRLKYIDLLRFLPTPVIFTAADGSIDIEKMKKIAADSLAGDNPDISIEQRYLQGANKLGQGQYLAAQQIFDSILAKSPAYYPALVASLKTRLLKPSGNPLEVVKTIDRLIHIPQGPDLLFITAMAYALSGNTPRAKKIMGQLDDEKVMRILPVKEAMLWLEKDLELAKNLPQKVQGD